MRMILHWFFKPSKAPISPRWNANRSHRWPFPPQLRPRSDFEYKQNISFRESFWHDFCKFLSEVHGFFGPKQCWFLWFWFLSRDPDRVRLWMSLRDPGLIGWCWLWGNLNYAQTKLWNSKNCRWMLVFAQNVDCFSFWVPWMKLRSNRRQLSNSCSFWNAVSKPCSTRGWTKTLEQFPKLSLERWTRFFLRGQLSYGSHWLEKKILQIPTFWCSIFPPKKSHMQREVAGVLFLVFVF